MPSLCLMFFLENIMSSNKTNKINKRNKRNKRKHIKTCKNFKNKTYNRIKIK